MVKKLTLEETENVTGGWFDFDIDYNMRRNAANIKCPVCGAEGYLRSVAQGYDGYSDGRREATDDCICENCGAQITLFPEVNEMAVKDRIGRYLEPRYPYSW